MLFDIVSLGEALIDFTPAGVNRQGNLLYECNPGGGAANLAVAAAMAGAKTAFIGKVGNDYFGRLLAQKIKERGVDISGLSFSDEYRTAHAFVLIEDGERSFVFCRDGSADSMLRYGDIQSGLLKSARLLHFTSLVMTNELAKNAVMGAVGAARGGGALISYDPNWRIELWESEEKCRDTMMRGAELSDIVKAGDDEILFMTGCASVKEAARLLLGRGVKLVLVSMGPRGSDYYFNDVTGNIPAFAVRAEDTTGAGDCYFGNALASIMENKLDLANINRDLLEYCLRRASVASALCCLGAGAMASMPGKEAVDAIIKDSYRYLLGEE